MKICIDEYKNFVIIISSKPIHNNLPIKINRSLEPDIKFIVSRKKSLTKYTIKNEIIQILFKYGQVNIRKNWVAY